MQERETISDLGHAIILLVAVSILNSFVCGAEPESATRSFSPAVTEEQIEADWLEQVKLRWTSPSPVITTQTDAAGGCDGVIDGQWGFHTQHEASPWWQVDLGKVEPLDRLIIYNRCDGGFAQRAARLIILLGEQPDRLQPVYQHPGNVFHGHHGGPPLTIPLAGRSARYVRLQLPNTDYFHLDEVEVYVNGSGANRALHQPADQSSVSSWSKPAKSAPFDWRTIVQQTVERGNELADHLQHLDVPTVESRRTLGQIQDRLVSDPITLDELSGKSLYIEARWAIRRMLLHHPVLDFDSILFVKRAPTQFPHLSDQYYGWWSRPGGGLYLLRQFRSESPRLECLSETFAPGNFMRPDLHFDAQRLVFAYCRYDAAVAELPDKASKFGIPEDCFYHLYEMEIDGSNVRRLTQGRYDDFDARYLPDDRLVFLSTRKGTFLQCTPENSAATLKADLPDSYVRCGGDDFRPVPVFTLHAMDHSGQQIIPLSAFETFEYTPSVAHDGRIVYCRWDYIDRFNGHFFSLWSTDQLGMGASLVYGNYTKRPQATMEPRAIPGSDKILFVAAAHHSITGGSLVLLDTSLGQEGEAPLTRLTPEIPFPETEQNVGHYFANPWPLSEEIYLVSWSNRPLPPHGRILDENNPVAAQGIYLLDRWGNLELLYRDPHLSSMTPIPLRPRSRPPVHAATVQSDRMAVGAFLVQDLYAGLTGVPRGSVKQLRVIGVPPKVQPQMNLPALGVSREETGKFVLGRIDVQPDGSAYFELPSGIPVFFQALDEQGRALQTMRSLAYVQPGEVRACVGCHESRQSAPASAAVPLAAQSSPSRLQADCEGTWPLRFDQLVQPVLDRQCVSCHQPGQSAAAFDLRHDKAYDALLQYADGDLQELVFERDASQPGETPSLRSKLVQYLRNDRIHVEVGMPNEDWQRLFAWMDTYGHSQGSFSLEQEESLKRLKREYAFLLSQRNPTRHGEEPCPDGNKQLNRSD